MTSALFVLVLSSVFFILYASLCVVETNRGKRLFAPYLRRALDHGIEAIEQGFERQLIYVGRYIITLSWYYSLHTFLKLVLQFIAGVYNVVEAILHRNRDKARKIRTERKAAERTHLTVLSEHRIETELTPAQKQKRNAKALSGK